MKQFGYGIRRLVNAMIWYYHIETIVCNSTGANLDGR